MRHSEDADKVGVYGALTLLLETRSEEAEVICRRLQASFDRRWAEEWNPKQGCPVVSISMGIAEFDQHESPEALMRRADNFMYEAKKRRGR
jgi:GGDEF domain-containing protein